MGIMLRLFSENFKGEFKQRWKIYRKFNVYPTDIKYYNWVFQPDRFRHHFDRLELLGDTVISNVIVEWFLQNYPSLSEGQITALKSWLASRKFLNKVALKYGILELAEFSKKFKIKPEETDMPGNMLEAFIGAIQLDKGITTARKVVKNLMEPFFKEVDVKHALPFNYKGKVLEWGRKHNKIISFQTEGEAGGRSFKATLIMNDQPQTTGWGQRKREAEEEAAKSFWEKHIREGK